MIWLLYTGLILAFAIPMAVAAVRFRPPLWRWLFVAEVLLLFWSFGNCFVPGSWREFGIFEIPLLTVGGALALISSILRVRGEQRAANVRSCVITPQMNWFYVTTAIIGLIILTH